MRGARRATTRSPTIVGSPVAAISATINEPCRVAGIVPEASSEGPSRSPTGPIGAFTSSPIPLLRPLGPPRSRLPRFDSRQTTNVTQKAVIARAPETGAHSRRISGSATASSSSALGTSPLLWRLGWHHVCGPFRHRPLHELVKQWDRKGRVAILRTEDHPLLDQTTTQRPC